MPGPWTESEVSAAGQRPGLYLNFQAEATALITGGLTGVVALAGIALWGPDEVVQAIENETELDNLYTKVETSVDIPFMVTQILKGGAKTVLVYRLEGTGALKSTLEINDTVAANVLTVDGKYNGVRGNAFTITISVNAINAARKDVVLKEGSVVLATWVTTIDNGSSGMVQALVDQINNDTANNWITATFVAVGNETLADISAVSMATGADGAAPIAADYTAMEDAFEVENFSVFVCDTQDAGILATMKTWIITTLRGAGKKVMWVAGAALADTVATAQSDAEGYNHEGIIYVYPGFKYNNLAGVASTANGSKAAARIAGMIAGRGLDESLTFAQISDINDVEIRLSNADIKLLLASGVLVPMFDGAKYKIERGLNTLTVLGSTQNAQFKKIQVMRILDGVENALTVSASDYIIGKFLNNIAGQRAMLGLISDFVHGLARRGILAEDYTVELDDQYSSTGDQMYVKIGIRPIDSIEYIYVTVTVQT